MKTTTTKEEENDDTIQLLYIYRSRLILLLQLLSEMI